MCIRDSFKVMQKDWDAQVKEGAYVVFSYFLTEIPYADEIPRFLNMKRYFNTAQSHRIIDRMNAVYHIEKGFTIYSGSWP